ncbi:MAG: NADPH-dependent reductase [Sporomusa sp.]|nr:NADPH-dependent reductase [Sporomusa sp.]
MTKILALIGSPRANGTNSQAVDEAIRGAISCGDVEVQKVLLNQLKIVPCQSCDSCFKTGRCHMRDDMEIIYEKIMTMDAFILAAPIYFNGISGQAKLVIDRCQPFWSAKYVMKRDLFAGNRRPGLFIATGGQPLYEGQFIGSQHVANLLFKMVGVKMVGSLMLPDLDARPLNDRPAELAQAFALGCKLLGE